VLRHLLLVVLSICLVLILIPGCSGFTTNPGLTATPATTAPRTVPASTSGEATAQVTRVIDGDTIEVNWEGKLYKVRYIGIDTPEVYADKEDEPYSNEASAKNKEMVNGKMVRLEKDISETDQYGRLLRYVYVGNLFVNAELVKGGYARAVTYPPDVKYRSLFQQLQAEAQAAGRGMWGAAFQLKKNRF
jgi:micrococcal nuclease